MTSCPCAAPTLALLFATALSCGGKAVVNDDPLQGDSGSTVKEGGTTQQVSCATIAPPPTIDYQQTCGSYIPSLGGTEVTFVERTEAMSAGVRFFAHRFRATGCGFDVVISLPGLKFAASTEPYELNIWWGMGSGPTRILAAILRNQQDRSLLLAVATQDNVSLLNSLASPLALTLRGPACPDASKPGYFKQVLEKDDTPLSCVQEQGWLGLRICRDNDLEYRMVGYFGLSGSKQLPGLFGASDSLTPVD